jgi:type 1 glutamine amidotransferase
MDQENQDLMGLSGKNMSPGKGGVNFNIDKSQTSSPIRKSPSKFASASESLET